MTPEKKYLVEWLMDRYTKAPPGMSFWDLVGDGYLILDRSEHGVAYYRLTEFGKRFIKGD